VIGSAVLAPSSFADRSDCPGEYVCLWDGNTYGGARAQFHDNGLQDLAPFGFDNITSSIYNNTNRWVRLYDGAGATSYLVICLGPGGFTSLNSGGFPPSSDAASSIWITAGNPGC
jgi:hypothetical protein